MKNIDEDFGKSGKDIYSRLFIFLKIKFDYKRFWQ